MIELANILDYNPVTGVFRWKIRAGRSAAGTVAGHTCVGRAGGRGYTRICIGGRQHLAHRLAWEIHYGAPPESDLDHINGIRDDNRITNLRLATTTENNRNLSRRRDNTSGHKGVHWSKGAKKWQARICLNKKMKNLGLFSSIEDAAAAYRRAAKAHFGEFYREAA